MQKNPSRRIRRNFDVLVNGQKNSRSVQKAINLSGLLKPSLQDGAYTSKEQQQNVMQIQNSQKAALITRNETLNKKMSGHHSHSQQLLENQNNLQQRILNQQNQLQRQVQTNNSPGPVTAKSKYPNLVEYPSQGTLNYLNIINDKSQAYIQNNGYYENITQQYVNQGSKEQRSLTQLQKTQAAELRYGSVLSNSKSSGVQKNTQNPGTINNNTIYNQIAIKETSPLKLVNIGVSKKASKKTAQVLTLQQQFQHMQQIQQYGQGMLPKQYSNKQMNSTTGNLSVGQMNTGSSQVTNFMHQTGTLNTSVKQVPNSNHLSTQPIMPIQNLNNLENVIASNNPAENINIQGYQTNNKLQKQTQNQHVDLRGYNMIALNRQNGVLEGHQTLKSRNQLNMQTTNGAIGQNNPNGAILNINTASDINIYNNSFIVKTSQNKNVQGKLSSRSNSIKRNQQKINPSKNIQRSILDENSMNNSVINNIALNTQPQGDLNYPRSLSQGRGSKPPNGPNTFPNSNGHSQVKQNEHPKAQAIAEAYNQVQQNSINNMQNHSIQQQQIQSWRSNQGSTQMLHTKGSQKQNQYSSEKMKYRTESNDTIEQKQIIKKVGQSGGYQPQYNNLISDPSGLEQIQAQLRKSGIIGRQNNQNRQNSKVKDSFSNNSLTGSKQNFLGRDSTSQKSQLNLVEPEMQIRKQKEDRVKELIIVGRKKIQSKEYTEAIKLFTQVLEQFDAKNIKAIFYRALSYLDQGNLQQAINEFWRVVSLYNEHNNGQEDSQNLIQSKGTTQILQNTSVNSRVKEAQLCQQSYILLSIAHKRLGESQNAIEDLDKCLKLFQNYPDALLARGQTLLISENFQKAHEDFKKFNELQIDSFLGQLGLGDCLKAMKNYTEAIDAYTAAILLVDSQKNKPNFKQLRIQCFMKRALASFHGQIHQQALSDFQTVIKEDNSEVRAHFYIGKLLSKSVENAHSKKEEAILHFEQVAKYPEKDFYAGNALFQIAKLRLKNKDYYEAYFALKRAADNNFASKRMQMYKDFTEGVLYLIKRKIKKGVQILTDLLEILINKEKELVKQQRNEKLNKKLTDPKGENQDPIAKVAREKQQASDKTHSDFLIQQIYIFREYGYVAIEKYELAQDDIRRLKRYAKLDAPTIYNKYLGKGILRMDHEDYLMASKYFTKAWKKFPQNKDPYCLQVISIVRSYSFSLSGYSVDQQIKFDKVLQTKRFMDKAIRNCNVKQIEPSLYFFRGLLNFHLHRFYDALQDFNKAIEQEEESTAYFFLARGRTYACLSILTEAMKDLSIALNLDETLQQGYIYRGKCAYLLGDNNLAFLDFQRLILTDPKNPMVHIYAGNLLMTTGAYSDAIKAFENADTVEPTATSAFQRVRCYCAISDLEKARAMMAIARQSQPDDVILQFDQMCLDQLYMVTQVTRQLNNTQARTAADIKHADKVLNNSMQILNMLIKTYESDKLTRLKRKDACLNIQLIPNIDRIKIEKTAVARDFFEMKQKMPENNDLPELDYNPSQKVDFNQLKNLENVSYYYENIFSVEDFYLYRGIINFYQHQFRAALDDFRQAQQCHNNIVKSANKDNSVVFNNQESKESWFGLNAQNHCLRMYTDQSQSVSVHSAKTDLSDVGLCSFNVNETAYNMLVCYIFIDDKTNAFSMINELFKSLPRKYQSQLPLIRALVLDHFGAAEKAQAELKRLKQQDSKTYDLLFGQKQSNRDNQKQDFLFELFPCTDRLCQQFEPIVLPIALKGLGANINFKVRLSFSIPFIKPPNMIPNVDEESLHSEFNLKQIDAPMPESPWIKRCIHGITFTSQAQIENATDALKQKYKQFFDTKKDDKKKNMEKKSGLNKGQDILLQANVAGARLLDQIQEEHMSEKHNNSLLDDSKIIEEECKEKDCESNCLPEIVKTTRAGKSGLRSATSNVVESIQQSQLSDENYQDSEDDIEESDDDFSKIISAHDELLLLDRDSVVNFGTNMAHEMKKQKKIKQHVQNMIAQGNNPAHLLPNAEETKALQEKSKKGTRYDDINDSLIEDEKIESLEFQSTGLFRSRVIIPKKEPQGLDNNMLIGQQAKKKKKERHISNLRISEVGSPHPDLEAKTDSARNNLFKD